MNSDDWAAYEAEKIRTRGSFVPSPHEINLMCEEIQSEWTADERERRNCHKTKPITMDAQRYQLGEFVD
ncbi:hypothetical protein Mal48_33450 [Thalassoglobus polymorphus]|uniref:Uncharacterized protein n=1 Tax=Thalassoglobus polymorphus TaxID=2527994 RepID=A0A517QR50_9PLAN|nr:hypothetical protein Mal48_33450 [Thalassoglobus polymorphus]